MTWGCVPHPSGRTDIEINDSEINDSKEKSRALRARLEVLAT